LALDRAAAGEAVVARVYSRAELLAAIHPAELIQAVEDGFAAYSRGEVVVPPVGHLDFDKPPGDCHIKYGYIRGDDAFTVKIATGFYRNPERGLPSSNGVVLVFSSRTGELLAILQDEGCLTDLRTAAAGAVAAKYLAPPKVECIGIVGAGTQARLQLEYLKEVTPCRSVLLWARSVERATAFQAAFHAAFHVEGFQIELASTVAELASRSQLIVTTTPARHWLLGADDVQPGTHITAVGADGGGKQELDPRLFARALCAVDSRKQCAQFGDSSYAIQEGLIANRDLIELGEIVQDRSLGRKDAAQITIADLTGVAVQDIQIAKLALQRLALTPN
jgi:ornithine cyclodeaminase